jgi:mandelate racemase
MAMWDAIAKSHGEPLYQVLGETSGPIKAYESSGLGLSNAAQVAEEAVSFVNRGFDTMKVRLGYPTMDDDELVLDAVRGAVGDDIDLMVDYNQALTFEQALDRCKALERFQLIWIEEPLHASDLEGAAKLTRQIGTPIQLGENLFSQYEVDRAISLQSSRYLMPDVMKIGGATSWLVAAHRAEQRNIPISSHLFPEISAHLLACSPNRHFLEYVNWADEILDEPIEPRDGYVEIPAHPGTSLIWDEKAVQKFQISI